MVARGGEEAEEAALARSRSRISSTCPRDGLDAGARARALAPFQARTHCHNRKRTNLSTKLTPHSFAPPKTTSVLGFRSSRQARSRRPPLNKCVSSEGILPSILRSAVGL